jgi:hypothetical protein
MNEIRSLDCECDGIPPLCPVCLVRMAVTMRRQHPDTLSVSMLKRRVPRLSGREAAILVEATRRIA